MSQQYPYDEFDSIEPSGRKGAHRRQEGGLSQTAAVSLIAVLAIVAALLVFGAIRIIGSSTVDPETQVAETQAPAAEDTPEPTAEPVDKTASVTVLNASGVSGAAKKFADAIEADGWTLKTTGNASSPLTETVVYYSDPELEAQAQAVADLIGAQNIEESSEYTGDLTVLLCSDIANNPVGAGSAGATDAAQPSSASSDGAGLGGN